MPGLKRASVNRKAARQAPRRQRHERVRQPRRSSVTAAYALGALSRAHVQSPLYSGPDALNGARRVNGC
jgi:hypothetical protein